jgi:CPA2 family monovalent cation:H+ antiporter-2
METFLFQATIYLGAAVIAVPLAARLGLGSVLGYLTAGILIGPVFGLVGTEAKDIQHFAEFGVVMMLFLIGLELEPRVLWDMRRRLVGLGGLQMLLTTGGIMGATMWVLGIDAATALAIGLIFALSSTAIVLQTLAEKGLIQTSGGRSIFSVLLTQDIAVIPALALLPLLATTTPLVIAKDGSLQRMAEPYEAEAAMSLVDGLPAWGVTLVTLGAVAAIILVGVFLTRPTFRYIHQARLREMNTALAL